MIIAFSMVIKSIQAANVTTWGGCSSCIAGMEGNFQNPFRQRYRTVNGRDDRSLDPNVIANIKRPATAE